jgi:hypothetical protein
MAVTGKLYAKFPLSALGGGTAAAGTAIDILDDTIKVSLHTSTYSVSQANDDFWDDATNEVSSSGYTADGATLGSKTYSTSSLVTTFDAADASWTAVTFTARYAVVYKDSGTDGTSPLIGYLDFGGDQSPAGVNFSIAWHASGIFTWTVA